MASHRRPASDRRIRVTVLAASAATAFAFTVQSANAQPAPGSADVSKKVDQLNAEAEKATEAYDGANERYKTLSQRVGGLQDDAASIQAKLNGQRDMLGTVASAQYRSAGIDPSAQLFLSSDPDSYLEGASMLDRESVRQATAIRETQEQQKLLDQERARATAALRDLSTARADMKRKKRDVQAKLASARTLLNSLNAEQREELGRKEADRDRLRPSLGDDPASSGRSAAALAAAESKVGSRYVWGASGPDTFDCSGLIQWAFSKAGTALPRTTYEQATVGTRLSRSQLQPGDLVFFFGDLTHAGIYAGNGVVVHAPHTGASVRYEAMNTVGPFEFGLRIG